MKTCKLKPSAGECNACLDIFDDTHPPHCKACHEHSPRYELLQIASGWFCDYAFVQRDGVVKKVALDRIYDIKEDQK